MPDKHSHSPDSHQRHHQNKQKIDKTHDLYHEAQRRVALRQQVVRHSEPKSLLLPAPNNIIFELFNTVVKEWPANELTNFIDHGIKDYLAVNWDNKLTQQMIMRLRREQAIDLYAGLKDIPSIRVASVTSEQPKAIGQPSSPATSTSPIVGPKEAASPKEKSADKAKVINDIHEHVTWRARTGNVTQTVSLLVKLIIDDGLNRGKLKAELYQDVVSCFQEWRANQLIKLYAFGDVTANDQKLILASTTGGDLTKWVANYIDGSDKRNNPDLIRKLATALRDRTKNCVYLTNNLQDAMQSYETGALRAAIVVDRLQNYQNLTSSPQFNKKIETLIATGKIFVVNSLSCIEFAPDPTSDKCC